MAKGQVVVSLQVTAQAGSKEVLIQDLYDQATTFFGDEEFVLERPIDVHASTEVSAAGKSLVTQWEGDAWFISEAR
jgi:hypothetical protein